jgi:hypothetical protein
MKDFKKFMACLFTFALLFSSCSKDEAASGETGEVATLSFGAIVNDLASKATTKQSNVSDLPDCSDDTPAYVRIVLLEGNQEIVGTTQNPYRVDLVPGQVFTEEDAELELEPGTYTLDHFSVYNSAGDLIWLAPKGGTLSQYVDNALPLSIQLGAGVKKYVDVSVLCFDDRDVKEYGYQFFELDTSEWFEFCFFANYCAPNGKHFPARYSVDISVNGVPLYTDRENEVGVNEDGDNFAKPLCLALPNLSEFDDDEDYITYTVTLLDWEGVYDAADGQVIAGSLSRNDIEDNFDGDDKVDYEHIRFNCGPTGGDCVLGVPTPGDADGDCKPDGDDCTGPDCDNCPGVYNPGQEDADGDKVGDSCDNCPNDKNRDQSNGDGDSLGDVCDNCPAVTNEDQEDGDGDTVGDVCDNCPDDRNANQNNGDGDSLGDVCDNCPAVTNENQADRDNDGIGDVCDSCPDLHKDRPDGDGDCRPDGEDPCPDDVNNECVVGEGCETAYMKGDTKLNDLNYKGNNWGWIEHFTDEGNGEYTYKIYAGAGQNDISKGTHVGNAVLTAAGDSYTLVVNYFSGVDVDDLHVYIGDTPPASRAPGQFDNQDDSRTYQFTDADGDFWFIVHAGVCFSASNN